MNCHQHKGMESTIFEESNCTSHKYSDASHTAEVINLERIQTMHKMTKNANKKDEKGEKMKQDKNMKNENIFIDLLKKDEKG